MNKILLIFSFNLFFMTLFAQDVIYTVSGELENNIVSLDSILVENLSNNTWITFNNLPEEFYYQINMTKKAYWGTTSVSSFDNNLSGFVESQNMPGKITLTYNNSVPTNARFSVFSISGQEIYSSTKQTLIPGNSVQIKLAETGVYLVRVESDSGTQSFKGIGLAGQNNYDVSVIDQPNFNIQTKSAPLTLDSNFEYSPGDSIRISVYKDINYAIPVALKIANSEAVNFIFETVNNETISLIGQISIENSTGINFSGMSVQSVQTTTPVKLNGTFQINNDTSSVFPVFVMDNEEVIFGFYPSATSNNNIKVDDILLFYIKMFPDITVLELLNTKILDLIRADENYETAKTVLVNSLNENSSPIQNPDLVNLLHQIKTNIVNGQESLKVATLGSDFEFEFTREGSVKWPGSNPIYATMGVEIWDVNGNSSASGPHLIGPKNYIISLSSLIDLGIKELVGDDNITSYAFPKDGEYQISFTNGQGGSVGVSSELTQKVYDQNDKIFLWDIIFLVVPPTLKKLFPDCFQEVISTLLTPANVGKDLFVNGSVSEDTKISFFYSLSNNLLTTLKECSLDAEALKHLDTYLSVVKYLDAFAKAESVTKLSLLARDFYGSNISGSEMRYYSNGFAFSELKLENMSPAKFYGNPNTEHRYESRITENKIGYSKKVIIDETIFTKEESWHMATDLKFKATTILGDASVKNPETLVKKIGTIHVDAIMGGDSSQVKIEPAFTTPHLKADTITLISTGWPLGFLEVYDGNHQNGQPGRWLKDSIRVITKDIKGNPISGIKVAFSMVCESTEPCGLLNPTTAYLETNSKGIAGVQWLLGDTEGYYHVKAKIFDVDTIPEVEFTATNKVLIPAILAVIDSTNNQIGEKETELPKPVKVIVKDKSGIPVPDIDVEFYFESDGFGSFNPRVVTTNEKGIAQTVWTLGDFGVQQSAKAKIVDNDTINPVQLFASTESPALYPVNGAYGPNVLNRDNTNIRSGNFSMHANIPEGEVLRVKIRGSFAYVLNHPTDKDWTWSQSGGGADLTVDFTSTHSGAVDFHLLINSAGVSIEVYENGDVTPTWTR